MQRSQAVLFYYIQRKKKKKSTWTHTVYSKVKQLITVKFSSEHTDITFTYLLFKVLFTAAEVGSVSFVSVK